MQLLDKAIAYTLRITLQNIFSQAFWPLSGDKAMCKWEYNSEAVKLDICVAIIRYMGLLGPVGTHTHTHTL